MILHQNDCAFYEEEYCAISDKSCNKPCKDAVKKYRKLDFKEHLSIYNHRIDNKRDLKMKWLTLLIAVMGLAVAFVANVDRITSTINKSTFPAEVKSNQGTGQLKEAKTQEGGSVRRTNVKTRSQ